MRILFYIFFICCLSSSVLYGQKNGQATILVDSTTFLLGDQIKAKIVVNVPKGRTALFPDVNEELNVAPFELLEITPVETKEGVEYSTFIQPIVFTVWEPGIKEFPRLVFSYKDGSSRIDLESNQLMLTVEAPQITGDSTYVADIKSILAEEKTAWDYLKQVLTHPITLVLLLLSCIVLAIWAIRKFKQRKEALEQALSPEELALRRLGALEANNPLSTHDFKAFHIQISYILRAYIEGRFAVLALESPTSEFLPKIKSSQLSPVEYAELKEVLELADLVKYAKASPLDVANKQAIDFSYALVRKQQALLATAVEEETISK